MATVFRNGCPNFPADQELNRRLEDIEKLIKNTGDNISFIESVFQLMQDCDLITESNVKYLTTSIYTAEGVLRLVENHDYDNILDDNNYVRFYKGIKRFVELNGRHYLISKEWYPNNKQALFNWLKEKAQKACDKHWTSDKDVVCIELEEKIQVPENFSVSRDDLKALLQSLEELRKEIDDVKTEIKALYKLWE